MLENETFENFVAQSDKEEEGGGSENSQKNWLSYTGCICGWSLSDLSFVIISDSF